MLQQAEDEDGPAEGRGHGVAFYFICDDADALMPNWRSAEFSSSCPAPTMA